MATRSTPAAGRAAGRSAEGALFTELVLEIFRVNGLLIAAGNEMSAEAGLTSARWQVLGAVALAGEPLTVAQIARAMGLTRQGVQRVVDELEGAGLVRRIEHAEHRKARPVMLTDAGNAAYAAVSRRQEPWANRTSAGVGPKRLETAVEVLRELRERLELETRAG